MTRGALALAVAGLALSLTACGDEAAKLKVTQTVADRTGPGDTVAIIISVTNLGPGPARGLQIQDRLPAGFQYQATTTIGATHTRTAYLDPQPGTAQPTWGTWTMAPPAGRENPLVVSFKVKAASTPGDYTNSLALVTSSPSTVEVEGRGKVTVNPRPALGLTVATSTPAAGAGSNAAYTITVQNTGSAEAPAVTVLDVLPPGFEFAGTVSIDGNASRGGLIDPPPKSLLPVWASWTIPAATREGPGLLRIEFQARILPGTPAGVYNNTVQIFNDKGLRIMAGEVSPVTVR